MHCCDREPRHFGYGTWLDCRQTTAFFIRAAYWGLFGGIFYGSGVTGPQLPVQCVSKYSVLHPICHCHTALLHYNIPAAFVISTTENTLYFKSLLYSSIIYVVKKKKKIYIYIYICYELSSAVPIQRFRASGRVVYKKCNKY